MWICLCEAVSDRTIDAVIDAGARSVKDVGEACAAGTVCGRCKANIAVLLAKHRADARRERRREAHGREH
jgi:bacterioferritin-associated ferredoxin